MSQKTFTKTVREIVITMLSNHESMDLIHRYTAMPLEEIEQIGREQQEKGVRKDTFFKTVFQNKTMFRMFIRDFVDAQWTQAVKEENLELLPSLYPEIIESTRENDVVSRSSSMMEVENGQRQFLFRKRWITRRPLKTLCRNSSIC